MHFKFDIFEKIFSYHPSTNEILWIISFFVTLMFFLVLSGFFADDILKLVKDIKEKAAQKKLEEEELTEAEQ